MSAGTPNRAMWCEMRAWAHEAAVASAIGMATGYRVYRSMIVNRYVIPREGGRGPTMSTWSHWKRQSGSCPCSSRVITCRCTLDFRSLTGDTCFSPQPNLFVHTMPEKMCCHHLSGGSNAGMCEPVDGIKHYPSP